MGRGPVPQGGSPEGGKVPAHWETPSQVGAGRASEPQREAQPDGCSEGEWSTFTTEMVQRALPSQVVAHTFMSAHSGWGLGGEAQTSGVHLQGEDQGLLQGRYSEVANMIQKQGPCPREC